jgi:hypothetical protein
MFLECLVYCSMRLGVPFIAPRQLGAELGRQFLPSAEWRTGQSGAPPKRSCSCSVRDLLPYLAKPTVGSLDLWRTGHCPVHTGLSSATIRPLASPRVAR